MNVNEAIAVDEELKRGLDLPLMLREANALDLSIEVLKERAEARRLGIPLWHPLLPGETEE